ATSVFVGMQPVLTHVPPKRPRSTTATLCPAADRRAARKGPDCPVPMTIASYRLAIRLGSAVRVRQRPLLIDPDDVAGGTREARDDFGRAGMDRLDDLAAVGGDLRERRGRVGDHDVEHQARLALGGTSGHEGAADLAGRVVERGRAVSP